MSFATAVRKKKLELLREKNWELFWAYQKSRSFMVPRHSMMGPGMCPGISKTCWLQPLPFLEGAEQGAALNTPSSTAQAVHFFLQRPLLTYFCSPFLVSLASNWGWWASPFPHQPCQPLLPTGMSLELYSQVSRGRQLASPIPAVPTAHVFNSSCSSKEQKKSPNPSWADPSKHIQPGSRRKGFPSALLPKILAQPDVERSEFSSSQWTGKLCITGHFYFFSTALQIFVGGSSLFCRALASFEGQGCPALGTPGTERRHLTKNQARQEKGNLCATPNTPRRGTKGRETVKNRWGEKDNYILKKKLQRYDESGWEFIPKPSPLIPKPLPRALPLPPAGSGGGHRGRAAHPGSPWRRKRSSCSTATALTMRSEACRSE